MMQAGFISIRSWARSARLAATAVLFASLSMLAQPHTARPDSVPPRRMNRRFIYSLLLAGAGVAAHGSAVAATAASGSPAPIAACAFGRDIPGLTGYLQQAVAQASNEYANALNGADTTTRAQARQVFAAAAAAYVYGLPQVTERATVKHFTRNEITSVAALANPQVQTVVAPNVDRPTRWRGSISRPGR